MDRSNPFEMYEVHLFDRFRFCQSEHNLVENDFDLPFQGKGSTSTLLQVRQVTLLLITLIYLLGSYPTWYCVHFF